MSRPYPVDYRARRRLLDAQRAETKALRDVTAVARRQHALLGRLEAVDRELARAESVLVSISGLSRAAQLLETEPRELKRRVKRVEQIDRAGGSAEAAAMTTSNTPSQ